MSAPRWWRASWSSAGTTCASTRAQRSGATAPACTSSATTTASSSLRPLCCLQAPGCWSSALRLTRAALAHPTSRCAARAAECGAGAPIGFRCSRAGCSQVYSLPGLKPLMQVALDSVTGRAWDWESDAVALKHLPGRCSLDCNSGAPPAAAERRCPRSCGFSRAAPAQASWRSWARSRSC